MLREIYWEYGFQWNDTSETKFRCFIEEGGIGVLVSLLSSDTEFEVEGLLSFDEWNVQSEKERVSLGLLAAQVLSEMSNYTVYREELCFNATLGLYEMFRVLSSSTDACFSNATTPDSITLKKVERIINTLANLVLDGHMGPCIEIDGVGIHDIILKNCYKDVFILVKYAEPNCALFLAVSRLFANTISLCSKDMLIILVREEIRFYLNRLCCYFKFQFNLLSNGNAGAAAVNNQQHDDVINGLRACDIALYFCLRIHEKLLKRSNSFKRSASKRLKIDEFVQASVVSDMEH